MLSFVLTFGYNCWLVLSYNDRAVLKDGSQGQAALRGYILMELLFLNYLQEAGRKMSKAKQLLLVVAALYTLLLAVALRINNIS